MSNISRQFVTAVVNVPGAKRRELIKKFVSYLKRTRRLSESREIVMKIEQELERRSKTRTIRGFVASRGLISDELMSGDLIKEKPELLGGAKLRSVDRSVDASVYGRIQKVFSSFRAI